MPERTITSQWPLVGRSESLRAISTSLRDASASVVVLCGPSGVGKTRLATEAAALLGSEGWFIIPVTASETLASIPVTAKFPPTSMKTDGSVAFR